MSDLGPVTIFLTFVCIFATASFITNLYLYYQVQSLRYKIDSIDRIGKLAKLECPKLKASANSKEQQAQVGIVIDLISSILNATAVPKKPEQNKFEKTIT